MPHFVMDCRGEPPIMPLGTPPDLPGGPWMSGSRLDIEVPNPLVYQLAADRTGNLKAMYKDAKPLMRDDLLAALTEAGVENLELFDAVLKNPSTGEEHLDYKAVNVIGVVSCADMDASKMMGTSNSAMIDADFDSLVIDESRTKGMLLFRLAESVGAIVVHEKVKRVVEDKGIPGMVFYGPGQWSG